MLLDEVVLWISLRVIFIFNSVEVGFLVLVEIWRVEVSLFVVRY